jgi:hypothetical protein
MKKLVLVSLIALVASQAAGCIITSGDDDGGNAYITANWTLRSEASNTNVSCPPGTTTAALYNQPVDAAGNNAGSVFVDLFNCADGTGTSAPLPPTTYLTWVELANDNNTSVYAKSLSAFVDVTVSNKTFSTQILVDGGYFMLQWGLVDAQTNAPLSCSQALADGVEAIGALVSNPNMSNSDIFDCTDGRGITAGYTMGTYTVSVHAVNTADQQLGNSVVLADRRINAPNAVTDLGTVNVPID